MDDASLDAAWKSVVMFLYGLYNNFIRNSVHMWDDMTLTGYLRLVAIVGAYLLLRPWLVKLGERMQRGQLEKEEVVTTAGKGVRISANDLRGGKKAVKDGGAKKGVSWGDEGSDDSQEETATGKDVKWGKQARKRARQAERREIQEKEKNAKGEDLLDLLVDYEEGADGW